MFSKYRKIPPTTRLPTYGPGATVKFLVKYPGLQIVPGSFHLLGQSSMVTGAGEPFPDTGLENVFTEPAIGDHCFFNSVATSTGREGNIETLNPYPLLVKTITDFTIDPESLDTETMYAMEGRCRNEVIRAGYLPGRSEEDPWRPFAIKIKCAANMSFALTQDKATGLTREVPCPVRYSDHGDIGITIILASVLECLYGAAAAEDAGATYQLKDLQLYYEVEPESASSIPGYWRIYNIQNGELNGSQNTLVTAAAGATEAVHMTFLPKSWLGDPTKNKYSTPALFCTPVYCSSAPDIADGFGASEVSYTIADQGSALLAYTMNTREEMLVQTAKSFGTNVINDSAAYWGTSMYGLSRPSGSFGYALGIGFGRALDLTKVRFSATVKAQVTIQDAWAAYLFLRQKLPFGYVAPGTESK